MSHSYSLNNAVPLEGFLIVLPFDFDSEAHLRLQAERATAVAHLRLGPSDKAAFPAFSAKLAEAEKLDWDFCSRKKNKVISLAKFRLDTVLSAQAVGVGESLALLTGLADTTVKITTPRLPQEQFPFFHKDGTDRFAWGGELVEGEEKLLKIAAATVDLDVKGGFVRSFAAAGPVRAGLESSVFSWLTNKRPGNWYGPVLDGDENKAEPIPADNPLPLIYLNDLRRDGGLRFFGNDDHGVAQVLGAKGAVFFATGSFARLSSLQHIQHLAGRAHAGAAEMQRALLRQLHSQSLEHAMTDAEQKKDEQEGENPTDVLFEGLTLWNLQPRIDSNKNPQVAKPLFL